MYLSFCVLPFSPNLLVIIFHFTVGNLRSDVTRSALSQKDDPGISREDGLDGKRIKMGFESRECVQGMFREFCPGNREKRVLANMKYPAEPTL